MQATTPRDLALDLLTNHHEGLTWKASQFLGNVAGCPDRPLTAAQFRWLGKLAAEAGLEVQELAA